MTDICQHDPADPRVERLAAWLRDQGDDAPGLVEAAMKLLGLDALLLARGDQQHRLHRVGHALAYEIGRVPDTCTGRRAACMTAAVREVERAVTALHRVRDRPDDGDRHPMADYARFSRLADEAVSLLAVAERDDRQRVMFVVRARELIADLEEGLVNVEDADPEWSGWVGIDPPRGTVLNRDGVSYEASGSSER